MLAKVLLRAGVFVLVLLAVTSSTNAAVGTTYTVDTTDGTTDNVCGGASDCSFGDAIVAANAHAGKDTIAFDIPGAGPHLIVVAALPATFPFVTEALVIDGFSEGGPDYAGTPLVEIDVGGRGAFGLLVIGDSSAGTEVRGLAIYGSTSGNDNAIDFDNPGRNIVEHNFIGVDASGKVSKGAGGVAFRRVSSGDGRVTSDNLIADNVIAGSTGAAVQLDEASDNQVLRNLIGTDATGKVGISQGLGVGINLVSGSPRNLLADNVIADKNRGIKICCIPGFGSEDNRIVGNRIGTDISGTVDLGNSAVGIDIGATAPRTIIGGADAAARNVISGNDQTGLFFTGPVDGTILQGNLIGTEVTGTLDLGNGGVGVSLAQTVGSMRIADNVISGNDAAGISGATSSSGSVRIEGNLVGTNEAGTVARGNSGNGIALSGTGIVIGGESEAQRNVISGNGASGVVVGGLGMTVLNNYVGTDRTGTADLGNTLDGVRVSNADVVVGAPGAGNLVSGNDRHGVVIGGDSIIVQANRIGTNADGTAALGNGGSGITTTCCYRDPRIGGGASGERNLVSGNGAWGIDFLPSGSGDATVVIEGNRIGTNASGAARLANGAGGVHLQNANLSFDVVNNLISGNGGDGLDVEAVSGPTASHIVGNLIGTDGSGASAVGNAGNGVRLGRAALGGKIVFGGPSPSDRNVVSGNGANGVLVVNAGHEIEGNYVGTDVDGARSIPNSLSGLRVQVAPNTVQDNVFSGNGQDGIELLSGAQRLTRNLVGTGADGTSPLGNARHGVSIEGSGSITQHTIGGQEGDGNTIAFNGGHGVSIRRAHLNLVKRNAIFSNGGDGVAVVGVPPFGAIRNTISENSIFSNGGLGIDLQDDGVTPNDLGDGDGGSGFAALANFLQNTPVNLQVSADRTTVTGTLNSRPNTTYRIEVFGSSAGVACDPSGNGEGEIFLTATERTTDVSGNTGFSVTLPGPLPGGHVVSATATDLGGTLSGNTSEFSQCQGVPESATIVVRKVTEPSGDSTEFAFTGDAAGSIGDGQTVEVVLPAPATYTSRELVPSGWDLKTIVCDDTDSSGAVGTATASFRVVANERVTCTFTNTKRGSVTLKKTTNGVVDPTKDILFVLTGPGLPSAGITRSTFGDQDGVLEFGSGNLSAGQTYKICETPVPAGFTSFWKLDGVIVTPYNPDASKSPPQDLGTRCYDFSVSPGQARAFEVDNSHPGGDPRTIGYWKNWNRCTGGNQSATAEKNGGAAAGFFLVEDLLPQLIGDFSVTSCQQAVKLLSKQDQSGKSKSSDAGYELGAQLLAARFNVAAGAETCAGVQQAVLDGQTLLDAIDFTGSGDYLGSKSKDPRRAQALALAATLDRYNNGNLC